MKKSDFIGSMKKHNQKIIAGVMLALTGILAVSLTYGSAFAQENNTESDRQIRDRQNHDRPTVPHSILAGSGAVVTEEDDHAYRSHFALGLLHTPVTTDDDEINYQVKRGMFVVGKHDTKIKYYIVPESWVIEVEEEKLEASGLVEGKDGDFYTVEITGEKIRDLQRGTLYYVTGEASDGQKEYDLFYIAAMFDRTPPIRPLPVETSES